MSLYFVCCLSGNQNRGIAIPSGATRARVLECSAAKDLNRRVRRGIPQRSQRKSKTSPVSVSATQDGFLGSFRSMAMNRLLSDSANVG